MSSFIDEVNHMSVVDPTMYNWPFVRRAFRAYYKEKNLADKEYLKYKKYKNSRGKGYQILDTAYLNKTNYYVDKEYEDFLEGSKLVREYTKHQLEICNSLCGSKTSCPSEKCPEHCKEIGFEECTDSYTSGEESDSPPVPL